MSQAATGGSAHVVVLGNEKGGSGKSTCAMHIAVALLKSGFRVATIDTDSRQRSLTRYIENRERTARKNGRAVEVPLHHALARGAGDVMGAIAAEEFAAYAAIVDRIEGDFDFIVVDTPASDAHMMRLSHGMADTLVTPINDSFIDLDIFGQVDAESFAVTRLGHYAELVASAIADRARVDGRATDWVVLRNRVSPLASRNNRRLAVALGGLSRMLDFRIGAGLSERVIFRELFLSGLTVLDPLDREMLGSEPTMSHLAARNEIRALIASLRLPGVEPLRRLVEEPTTATFVPGLRAFG